MFQTCYGSKCESCQSRTNVLVTSLKWIILSCHHLFDLYNSIYGQLRTYGSSVVQFVLTELDYLLLWVANWDKLRVVGFLCEREWFEHSSFSSGIINNYVARHWWVGYTVGIQKVIRVIKPCTLKEGACEYTSYMPIIYFVERCIRISFNIYSI